MKKQKGHLIKTVKPDSIAEEMGIQPGDRLLEINGETVEDIFDYQYYDRGRVCGGADRQAVRGRMAVGDR